MVTERVSLGSTSADATSSAIGVSSLPVTSLTLKVGVSATAVRSIGRLVVVDALSLPSTDVAVTVRLIVPLTCSGGVITRPLSSAGVSVTVPSGFTVPAEKVVPAGTSLKVIDRTSLGAVSADAISSATGVSSMPDAGVADKVGASATASNVTVKVSTEDAVSVPSVDVAVTVRSNEPL